jgi:hypothetical protein
MFPWSRWRRFLNELSVLVRHATWTRTGNGPTPRRQPAEPPSPRRRGRHRWLFALLFLAALAVVAYRFRDFNAGPSPARERAGAEADLAIARASGAATGVQLCFWNVENLFDDTDDPRNKDPLDEGFARDPSALARKLQLLADALVPLNDGRGPDLLALVEVENRRAVDLLRQTLNARLDPAWHYPEAGLVHRDLKSGRAIEPALLSRILPARPDGRPAPFGDRILHTRVGPDDRPLFLNISHWTSRVGGAKTVKRRSEYASSLYRLVLRAREERPSVDLLLCGDFNDEPDDPSVRDDLRAIADPSLVLARANDPTPYLLNLTAALRPSAGQGTYLYGRRWQVFDQIVVTPNLLDPTGWRVLPETLAIAAPPGSRSGARRGPLRFVGPNQPEPRGPSDHFPLTVRLSHE